MSNPRKSTQITVSSVLVIIVIALWNAFMGDSTTTPATQPVAEATEVVVDTSSESDATPVDITSESSDATPVDSASQSTEATAVPTKPKKKPTAVKPTPATNGSLAADSGFDVKTDGFSFENYGNDTGISNLKANDMRRLFGDAVCTKIKNNTCTLTSPARQWMKEINAAMDGGHCEGMAVASLHMFHQIEDPNTFGAPTTNELPFDGNTKLQEEIAYWWATQTTEPTMSKVITGKPSDVLKLLASSLSQGKDASVFYSIGIYMEDGSGGHAVTPVSITDLGNSKYGLNVYDNNWPDELRTINVNIKTERWSYQASQNPKQADSLYSGDTLEITPSTPRLATQTCDFCGSKGTKSSLKSSTRKNTFILRASSKSPSTKKIKASTKGSTLFVTPDGKRIGYLNGKLINEIAGATIRVFKSAPTVWDNRGTPIVSIPEGVAVTLKIISDPTYNYSISAFGDGKVVTVSNLSVSETKASELNFGNTIKSVKIKSAVKTKSNIFVGDESTVMNKDTSTQFTNVEIPVDGVANVTSDNTNDQYSIGGNIEGKFGLNVVQTDNAGTVAFSNAAVKMLKGARMSFIVSSVSQDGASLDVNVDQNGDGSMDQHTTLAHNSDTAAINSLTSDEGSADQGNTNP